MEDIWINLRWVRVEPRHLLSRSDVLIWNICRLQVTKKIDIVISSPDQSDYTLFDNFIYAIGYTKQWAVTKMHEGLPIVDYELNGYSWIWTIKPATQATTQQIPIESLVDPKLKFEPGTCGIPAA